MAELKTRPTGASVTAFINAIADQRRRQDCRTLAAISSLQRIRAWRINYAR